MCVQANVVPMHVCVAPMHVWERTCPGTQGRRDPLPETWAKFFIAMAVVERL